MEFSGKQPIFIQIADYYERMIRLGVYKPGSSLPSVREVAIDEGINPNTVAKAFQVLADREFVVSIPKKGYFVAEQHEDNFFRLKQILISLKKEGFSTEEIEEALEEIGDKNHD